MNVITVNINGMEYNLRGEENEEYLHKVARRVDKNLKHILEGNPKLSVSSAAVLTAINAVDDMLKCDLAYEEVQKELDEHCKTEGNLIKELNELKKQLKASEDRNAELLSKLQNNSNDEFIKEKEKEIENLNSQLQILQESAKRYMTERNNLKTENKNLKFEVQSYKYKTMDLQNKLIEKGIDLAKAKKMNNPLASAE